MIIFIILLFFERVFNLSSFFGSIRRFLFERGVLVLTVKVLPIFLILLFTHNKHFTFHRLLIAILSNLKLVIDPLLIVSGLFDKLIHQQLGIDTSFVVHDIRYLLVDIVPSFHWLFVLFWSD